MRILLLTGATEVVVDGNCLRLGNALIARGHEVHWGVTVSLGLQGHDVVAASCHVLTPLLEGEPMPAMIPAPLAGFDLVWVLALGLRENFLDTLQLLYNAERVTRVINSTEAIMYLKSKYLLASAPAGLQHPETHAGTDPNALFDIVNRDTGRWIVKPPAGSLGRNVYLITRDDPNARVILDTMTGNDQSRYCLLQRWVPEIEAGEKRVLLAGGRPVACYARYATLDHRSNVVTGARTELAELTLEETEYCRTIGAFLQAHGAAYAGIDLAFPWLIECNVINPGGLATITGLGGGNASEAVLDALEF